VIGRNVAGLAPFASTGAYIVDGEITILGNGCGETPDEVLRPCQLIRSQPLKFKRLPR